MTIKIISAAIAAALAITPAAAAPRAPSACSTEAKLIKATVQGRQKGVDRAAMDKLADQIEGDLKPRAHQIIARIYSDEVFATIAPATASAFLSANCAR